MVHKMEILLKVILAVTISISNVFACGDNFTDLAGTFTSPDYYSRNMYPPNTDCDWTISTPEGTNIVLIILDFDLRCPDYLAMTDYSNNTRKVIIGQACNLNNQIYTLGNRLHIRFVSDVSNQRRGFKISWKVKSKLTWHSDFVSVHEAHDICRRQGGGLVKDIAEYQEEILNFMQERHVTSIWQAKNTYITPWVWLQGCFNFTTFDDFETFATIKDNAMAECQRHCHGWNYFGLQEDTCFCLESFAGPPLVMDQYCTIPCTGNNEERCGGNQSLTIYMNDVCYKNSSTWQGTVSRTKGGNLCLPWNNITAVVNDNSTVFPDGSALNASNFCRNPNGSESLWCYVSQNETERCDIPPCFDKGLSSSNCMAVYLSDSNELIFSPRPCSSEERAICYDLEEDGYVVNSRLTWRYHRHNVWRGSLQNCKSLVGPSLFFMDKGRLVTNNYYYWIGQYRSSKTSTEIYSGVDNHWCYTIGIENNWLNQRVTDCDSKRHFICQTIPDTCGGYLDSLANSSFSTPGYPGGYSPLTRCIWTIHVPEDYLIMLTIDVDIEDAYDCRYDYLNVYFGAPAYDNLNSTLCGRIVKEFDNVKTNVSFVFISDGDKGSKGINVTWYTVSITTTTQTTSIVNTTTDKKFSKQIFVEDTVKISNGALAGIIVAVVLLLVLSCLGGYLFGTRGRPLLRKKQSSRHEKLADNSGYVNGGVSKHSVDTLDNGYSRTKSFINAGFEDNPSNVEQLDARKNQDKGDAGVSGNGPPLYSVVNKSPNGKFSLAQNNSASESNLESKPDNTYNRLHEKHDDTPDKKPVNVYNRFQERDPLYDDTVLPSRSRERNDVSPKIDTYHHKKK